MAWLPAAEGDDGVFGEPVVERGEDGGQVERIVLRDRGAERQVGGPVLLGPHGPRQRAARAQGAYRVGEGLGGGEQGEFGGVQGARRLWFGQHLDEPRARAVGGEQRESVGRDVTRCGPDGQQQVGLAHPPGERVVASVAERADVHLGLVVDEVLAAEVHGHGKGPRLGPVPYGGAGFRGPAAAAEEQEGTFGRLQQPFETGEFGRGRAAAGDGHRGGVGDADDVREHVLRQAQDHGSRPAAGRDGEGAGDVLGDACGVVDRLDELGARAERAAQVEFLEGGAVGVAARHQADEEDHRCGVLVGGVQGDQRVGGAWAPGREADSGAPGELSVGLRHVGGAAFVAADDHVDRGVVQSVERGEVALAGHAVDGIDAVCGQLVDEDLAAGTGGVVLGHAVAF